jgi:hypothetical protein
VIPPPARPRSRTLVVVAIAVALVATGTSGVLAVRLNRERARNDDLSAQLASVRAELDDLRQRLTGDATGGVLEGILRAVSQLRGLSILRAVNAQVLTDAELRARVISDFERDNPKADVEKSGKVLTALGLLKPTDDLYKILVDVQAEQVAGFYDASTKQMVVGGNAKDPSPLDRVFLAHEYTHALADQHFDISRLQRLNAAGRDDEAEAYLCLLEGDATLLMDTYAREALTASQQSEYDEELAAVKTPVFDAAPSVVRQTLTFPYDAGLKFVQALYARGGNAAIDRAYKDPPVSTEQILHPEKYLNQRDVPTAVIVPDIVGALGEGWSKLDDGGIGELDVRLILDQYLSQNDAFDAASGWDGGRYLAAQGPGGVVVAGSTVWDSESAAEGAQNAFDDWLPLRYGRSGSLRRIAHVDGISYESPSGAGEVVRAGSQLVFLVCGRLPDCDQARTAFGTFGSTAV